MVRVRGSCSSRVHRCTQRAVASLVRRRDLKRSIYNWKRLEGLKNRIKLEPLRLEARTHMKHSGVELDDSFAEEQRHLMQEARVEIRNAWGMPLKVFFMNLWTWLRSSAPYEIWFPSISLHCSGSKKKSRTKVGCWENFRSNWKFPTFVTYNFKWPCLRILYY